MTWVGFRLSLSVHANDQFQDLIRNDPLVFQIAPWLRRISNTAWTKSLANTNRLGESSSPNPNCIYFLFNGSLCACFQPGLSPEERRHLESVVKASIQNLQRVMGFSVLCPDNASSAADLVRQFSNQMIRFLENKPHHSTEVWSESVRLLCVNPHLFPKLRPFVESSSLCGRLMVIPHEQKLETWKMHWPDLIASAEFARNFL